jgi:serine/threonine protein phosphatase PrpC
MQSNKHDSGQDIAAELFVAPHAPINVEFGAASHVGLVRSINEDHFAVFRRIRAQEALLTNLPHDNAAPFAHEDAIFGQIVTTYFFVVADGMGGGAAGEVASRVAIQSVFDLADRASSWVMRLKSLAAQQMQHRIDAYTTEMHRTLRAMGESDAHLRGMGTTWTSAYLVGWNAVIVQIGDSRAYLWRRGELRQITRDQTLAQVLIDRGIPPEETEHVRNILTNALGGRNEFVCPDIFHVVLEHGDRLLLCTDGLTRDVSNSQITEVLASPLQPQAACDAFVKLALEHGGNDNITVVLADVTRHSTDPTG